jgi:hypothetical protein
MPVPTPEQHAALLHDVQEQLAALPRSGATNAGGRPYRASGAERAVKARADDPPGLLAYVTKLALQPASPVLAALADVDRVDLSIESLVADEGKVYAPLFGDDARAAARAKLGERAGGERDDDRRIIEVMNRMRASQGMAPLSERQERRVLERRVKERARRSA